MSIILFLSVEIRKLITLIYFFNVPLDKNIRFKCYKRVHREENKLKKISKARLSCCKNHFYVGIICTITI